MLDKKWQLVTLSWNIYLQTHTYWFSVITNSDMLHSKSYLVNIQDLSTDLKPTINGCTVQNKILTNQLYWWRKNIIFRNTFFFQLMYIYVFLIYSSGSLLGSEEQHTLAIIPHFPSPLSSHRTINTTTIPQQAWPHRHKLAHMHSHNTEQVQPHNNSPPRIWQPQCFVGQQQGAVGLGTYPVDPGTCLSAADLCRRYEDIDIN